MQQQVTKQRNGYCIPYRQKFLKQMKEKMKHQITHKNINNNITVIVSKLLNLNDMI